jgi:hypothetical protein
LESKRLHVTYPGGKESTEYSVYAGDEGMMAFMEGQYSKNLPAAGMLGYVMDGNTDAAWDGLAACLEDRRDSLRLPATSKLVKSTLAQAVSNSLTGTRLGETLHDLKIYTLRLFHLLLPHPTFRVRPRGAGDGLPR